MDSALSVWSVQGHFADPSSQGNTPSLIKYIFGLARTQMGARGPLRLYTGICWSFLEEATSNGLSKPFVPTGSGYNGRCLGSLITYLTLFPPQKIVSFQKRWVWTNMNVSCKRKLSVTDVVTEYHSILAWYHWVMRKKEMRILWIHKSVNSFSQRAGKINSLA